MFCKNWRDGTIPAYLFIVIGALSSISLAAVAAEKAPMPKIVRQDKSDAPVTVPLTIAGDKIVKPWKLSRLTVRGVPPGYTILWDVYPFENIDVATPKLKSNYEFIAPPGRYKIRVRAFKGEDVLEAWYEVELLGSEPTPVPPTPIPPTPVPVDQFTKDVATAYAQEPLSTRQVHTKALASLYAAASTTTVNDPTITTNEQLFRDLTVASDLLAQQGKLPKSAIPKIRATIGSRLTGSAEKPGTLRNPAAPIDRMLAGKELKAVADALNAAAVNP